MFVFSRLEIKVARHYLFSHRRDSFISVAVFVSFIGVMIGVMALIVVMSVMNGFRADIIKRVLGVNGHIIVYPNYSQFKDYKSIENRLSSISDVKKVLPFVNGQAFISNMGLGGSGVSVRGIEETDFTNITGSFVDFYGNKSDIFMNGRGIVIGENLAKNLDVIVGDKVKLISPNGDVTPLGTYIRSKTYTVSAIFKTTISDYDSGMIYMSLKEAKFYFNLKNDISGIEIFAENPDKITTINKSIQEILGYDVSVIDWRQRYKSLFSAMEIENNAMFVILTLIVFVASLNIVSSLIMLVKEKSRDIAVLRTMGASISSIMRIFFMIGAFVGISGTFVGVISGILISLNIDLIRKFILNTFGIVIFDINAYALTELPVQISWHEVLWVIIMAVLLSFFATIFPSWRASRVDPVKTLRYE
ncbi:lipoprotein-releasing ABC transporter permease subunit [Candidatus Liberibacter americanus]|uniref:Lipoprotein releasing system transmembrane protein LolC n=1 Tax=Candidatus Liberibacter americanus str. Sao Paulo TaxID=1261131 RepID=U6B866_9HYPH|nr:lipoprotein-releasing ABC transporter permease subunit [Candidatus Liberibacter americanus]AHA27927.1 Lipoprotein releasing system transmembrane protein LolC [Candidatus Liberibacter americanus str. Sao Paulo]EMS36074.1 lipoprotein releasing system, transmembrane protein, LolC/E family [Candidatus Liberibacter americanus PW_SP]